MRDEFNEYDIGDRIFYVTIDNGTMTKNIYDSFKNCSISSSHGSYDSVFYMCCVCHIIN